MQSGLGVEGFEGAARAGLAWRLANRSSVALTKHGHLQMIHQTQR